MLVVELNSTGDGLSQSKSRGLGLDVLELVPLFLSHVLSDQRVLGGNEGEVTEVFLLEFLVLLPESVDTVNHLLYQLNLRVSESVFVGDVISESSLSTRFTTGSTGLQVQLFTTLLQSLNAVLGPSRKVDVYRGPHTSTKVGWARVDVTELLRQLEVLARLGLDTLLDSLDSAVKVKSSLNNALNVSNTIVLNEVVRL